MWKAILGLFGLTSAVYLITKIIDNWSSIRWFFSKGIFEMLAYIFERLL